MLWVVVYVPNIENPMLWLAVHVPSKILNSIVDYLNKYVNNLNNLKQNQWETSIPYALSLRICIEHRKSNALSCGTCIEQDLE